MNWAPPVLRTERLVIRPFRVEDLDFVHRYAREHDAGAYGSWLGGTTPGDVARYLADTIARYHRPPRCDLGVALNGQLIGGVAFRQVWIAPLALEVGWVLHPSIAGKGLAREAVSALVQHLTTIEEVVRLEARVRTVDERGARLLNELGFKREGTMDYGKAGGVGIFGRVLELAAPVEAAS